MLKAIYSIYCNHVKTELYELHQKRQFSLTWAIQESKYLLAPLLISSRNDFDSESSDYKLFIKIAKQIPLLLVEKNGERKAISLEEFEIEKYFWTIDCQFFHFAEFLIREAPNKISLSQLITSFHLEDKFEIPEESILCGFNEKNILDQTLFIEREIDKIKVLKNQRRIDCRWLKKEEGKRWYSMSLFSRSDLRKLLQDFQPFSSRRLAKLVERLEYNSVFQSDLNVSLFDKFKIGKEVEIIGNGSEIAVNIFGYIYLYPNTDIAKYLIRWMENELEAKLKDQKLSKNKALILALVMYEIIDELFNRKKQEYFVGNESIQNVLIESTDLGSFLYKSDKDLIDQFIFNSEFNSLIKGTNWEVFDLSVYDRQTRQTLESMYDENIKLYNTSLRSLLS